MGSQADGYSSYSSYSQPYEQVYVADSYGQQWQSGAKQAPATLSPQYATTGHATGINGARFPGSETRQQGSASCVQQMPAGPCRPPQQGLRKPSVSPWHFASQGTGRRMPQRGIRRLVTNSQSTSMQMGSQPQELSPLGPPPFPSAQPYVEASCSQHASQSQAWQFPPSTPPQEPRIHMPQQQLPLSPRWPSAQQAATVPSSKAAPERLPSSQIRCWEAEPLSTLSQLSKQQTHQASVGTPSSQPPAPSPEHALKPLQLLPAPNEVQQQPRVAATPQPSSHLGDTRGGCATNREILPSKTPATAASSGPTGGGDLAVKDKGSRVVETAARLLHALSHTARRDLEIASLKTQLRTVENICTQLTMAIDLIQNTLTGVAEQGFSTLTSVQQLLSRPASAQMIKVRLQANKQDLDMGHIMATTGGQPRLSMASSGLHAAEASDLVANILCTGVKANGAIQETEEVDGKAIFVSKDAENNRSAAVVHGNRCHDPQRDCRHVDRAAKLAAPQHTARPSKKRMPVDDYQTAAETASVGRTLPSPRYQYQPQHQSHDRHHANDQGVRNSGQSLGSVVTTDRNSKAACPGPAATRRHNELSKAAVCHQAVLPATQSDTPATAAANRAARSRWRSKRNKTEQLAIVHCLKAATMAPHTAAAKIPIAQASSPRSHQQHSVMLTFQRKRKSRDSVASVTQAAKHPLPISQRKSGTSDMTAAAGLPDAERKASGQDRYAGSGFDAMLRTSLPKTLDAMSKPRCSRGPTQIPTTSRKQSHEQGCGQGLSTTKLTKSNEGKASLTPWLSIGRQPSNFVDTSAATVSPCPRKAKNKCDPDAISDDFIDDAAIAQQIRKRMQRHRNKRHASAPWFVAEE